MYVTATKVSWGEFLNKTCRDTQKQFVSRGQRVRVCVW